MDGIVILVQLKKYFPPNHNLQFTTSIDDSNVTLTFLLSSNTKQYGEIGIATPLQLTDTIMLSIFPTKPMFHQPLTTFPIQEFKIYMYSVFIKIFLTNQENNILCENQGDKEAQKAYVKLSAHALKSTKALLNSSKLITYIISARVGGVS